MIQMTETEEQVTEERMDIQAIFKSIGFEGQTFNAEGDEEAVAVYSYCQILVKSGYNIISGGW